MLIPHLPTHLTVQAIIIAVLLGLVESLVDKPLGVDEKADVEVDDASKKRLVRRMRLQIWAGALAGLFIALCIGAAFIAVVSSART
jgi:high-affinity iron transporter